MSKLRRLIAIYGPTVRIRAWANGMSIAAQKIRDNRFHSGDKPIVVRGKAAERAAEILTRRGMTDD